MKTKCPRIRGLIDRVYDQNDTIKASARVRQFLRGAVTVVTRPEREAVRLARNGEAGDVYRWRTTPSSWMVNVNDINAMRIYWWSRNHATVVSDRELFLPRGMLWHFVDEPLSNFAITLLMHELQHVQQFRIHAGGRHFVWWRKYVLDYWFRGASFELDAQTFAEYWRIDSQIKGL